MTTDEFSPAFGPAFDALAVAAYDGCPWPIDVSCAQAEWDAIPVATQERALALASSTLHRLTGYRVGGCPIVVRPCTVSCAQQFGFFTGSTFNPHINSLGRWVNSCGCRRGCDCTTACSVWLPAPVVNVETVDVGGVDVTADTKVVGDRLYWVGDAECPFTGCQDLALDPGEPGTVTVTYNQTYPVDGNGAYAAGVMALEFAKACGGSQCRLPSGTTSVVRQGISIELAAGSFPTGYTGIEEVDAYIGLWRSPESPKWAPRVYSPDVPFPPIER